MSVPELISQQAVRLPDKPALQIKQPGGWQRYTYRQLDESSRRVSAYLRRRGYAGGDTAVLILENCPEWAVVYLGIVRAGLTCVPLDIEIHHSEIAGIIADCAAGVLFCSRQVREGKVAGDLLKGMRDCIIVDEDAFTDILSGEPVAAAPDATGRKAPASLIYTSGTTGEPKGVVLTHENLSANVQSAIKLELINEHDNLIVLLPLHHTYPFMVNLLVPLSIGATVTFAPPGFDPRRLTAFMREAGITVLTGVPQLFSLLYAGLSVRLAHIPGFVRMLLLPVIRRAIRREFGASFRFCVSGGARLEPLVARGLSRLGIKVIEGYGLTEASPVVSFNPVNRTKPGSVGVPLPGVEVRINEPDEEGEGEILIRGANVMQGYFKHADWSAEVLRDGWLYSGDRGYLDKDGYLFITGRSKDVIVLGSGKNIYPQELESYYGRSPYIKEICILEKTQESFGRQQQSLFAVVVVDLAYFRARGEVSINEKIR
ncbi:MAG: AMP-binding protein, partial [Candidatus Omnitrophica bacterium]|nr:AMP-binding protein [Candidatus Omnitrophota bacterium]